MYLTCHFQNYVKFLPGGAKLGGGLCWDANRAFTLVFGSVSFGDRNIVLKIQVFRTRK